MIYIFAEFLFIDLLLIHVFSLIVHDYVDLYPLNDIENIRINSAPLKRFFRTMVYSVPAIAALIVAVIYFGELKPFGVRIFMSVYFSAWIIFVIINWYKPYLFGAGEEEKLKYMNKFGRTHQILPQINDNPRPNTLHVVLHILFFINFLLMIVCGYNPFRPF